MSAEMPAIVSRGVLRVEAVVCFGPTFLYLLTGIVFLPHQLMLAVRYGATEPWFPVLYYLGITCFICGVWQLFRVVRGSPEAASTWKILVLLALGLPALFLGPVGLFALNRYEYVGGWPMIIIFVLLPLSGVVHLLIAARKYLFGAQQAVQPDRA